MTAEEVLGRLEGVRRSGAGWVARCPAHEDRNPSLSIREGDDGKVLLKCFAGCPYEAIVDAIAGRQWKPALGSPGNARGQRQSERERIEYTRRLWGESRAPEGTVVQDYLFGRGFTGEMPRPRDDSQLASRAGSHSAGLAIPASIRFHPRVRHPSGAYLPAMVAAVEDLAGEIVGIHRTFLKPDGTGKAEVEPNKMALGRVRGCVVRLGACAAEPVLCEGIETGLSILQATGLRAWAALGTVNLGQVELPAFVRAVIIAADNDEPGLKAARAAAEFYGARGYQVRILSPQTEGRDFNEVAEAEGQIGRAQGV